MTPLFKDHPTKYWQSKLTSSELHCVGSLNSPDSLSHLEGFSFGLTGTIDKKLMSAGYVLADLSPNKQPQAAAASNEWWVMLATNGWYLVVITTQNKMMRTIEWDGRCATLRRRCSNNCAQVMVHIAGVERVDKLVASNVENLRVWIKFNAVFTVSGAVSQERINILLEGTDSRLSPYNPTSSCVSEIGANIVGTRSGTPEMISNPIRVMALGLLAMVLQQLLH